MEQGTSIETAEARREATSQRRREREGLRFGWAVALLALGLVVAVAWSAMRGKMFVYQRSVEALPEKNLVQVLYFDQQSALDLVRAERGWQAIAASLALVPLWFVAWRRFRIAGGRWIGVAWSLSAGAAVIALVAERPIVPGTDGLRGYYPSVVAGAVLLASAFVVAPAPRDREELSELQVKSLVRRQR